MKQKNELMMWRPYKTIIYVDIAGHPKYCVNLITCPHESRPSFLYRCWCDQ